MNATKLNEVSAGYGAKVANKLLEGGRVERHLGRDLILGLTAGAFEAGVAFGERVAAETMRRVLAQFPMPTAAASLLMDEVIANLAKDA